MRIRRDDEHTCHCGAAYNGSDHCPECGCEQYESPDCGHQHRTEALAQVLNGVRATGQSAHPRSGEHVSDLVWMVACTRGDISPNALQEQVERWADQMRAPVVRADLFDAHRRRAIPSRSSCRDW